ncbi:MAG TPA: heparinase II/III family protein [Aliicoccus persicus]|uniref:Heparinase II/III family protein n=1 Tax=Aliicoccus persicus TaxID=930138 RepID=A0A921B5U7_9STAP|nr:heparinase II/III family protein [Aliicoccus persicus]
MFRKLRRQSSKEQDKNQELFKRLERIEQKLDGKVFAEDVFIDRIDEKDVLPLIKRDKDSIRIAKRAIKDVIEPFPNFETVPFDETFDWEVTKEKYGHSYQLYIQSLRVVSALLLEYEKTNKLDYLNQAKRIVESWMDYAEGKTESAMTWYDHPTANRAQILIHFLYHARNHFELNMTRYANMLERHAKVMSDPSIYKYNNHSLMMDRALIIIGRILNKEQFVQLGISRAVETFWYSFSAKGIHLENSPSYHGMVIKIYDELEAYLNQFERTLGEVILQYLEKAKKYYSLIAKPNYELPELGDSSGGKVGTKVFENVFDYELGLVIMQYEKPKPVYTTFISGMSGKTHKHSDDLSITLSYGDEDILVDAGRFNYSKSPVRSYMTSARAHSTLYMKGKQYPRENENRFTRSIDLTSYFDSDTHTLAIGKNEAFDDSSLYRTVIQLKEFPIIFVFDSAKTEDKTLVQNFNLHHAVEVLEHSKAEATLKLKSGQSVLLKQLKSVESYEVREPSEDKVQAVNTKSFGNTIDTKQLAFSVTDSSAEYVFETMIVMNPALDVNTVREDNVLYVTVDGKKIVINL